MAGWIFLLLLAVSILFVHYRAIVENLSSTLVMDPFLDGVKTHLNAVYHARFDPTYTYMEGVNYPYQEHIVAGTEFPGLAILEKYLTGFFPGLPDHVIGIHHAFLLLSILAGILVVFLLLREFGLPDWYTIPVSIGLIFLSPQHLRFVSHMGLAPPFVVPALIYGLWMFHKGRKWFSGGFIGLLIILVSLIHFYYLALCLFTVSFFFFFHLLGDIRLKRMVALAAPYLLMVGPALVFFLFWMILPDPVTDRTARPYGFFIFHAEIESVFASLQMPLFQWVDQHWIKFEKIDFEGWAYVGLVSGFFCLITLLRWIFSGFRKRLTGWFPVADRPFWEPLIASSVVLLLFACCLPFSIKGLEFLADYLGPVREFRSLGRFAWVFYYVINLAACTGFYYAVARWKNRGSQILVLVALPGVLLYEAYTFMHSGGYMYSPDKLRQIPELLEGQQFTDIPGLDFTKYQAILPVPYFNYGSNNFDWPGGGTTIQQSLVLASQTGLPVTGAPLPRGSLRLSFNQTQMVLEPYRMPLVFDSYDSQAPLLMLYSAQSTPEDSVRFLHLLDESELLYRTGRWSLYEVELSDFQKRIDKRIEEAQKALDAGTLHPAGELLSTRDTLDFLYENFDDLPAEKTYLGNGAWSGPMEEMQVVFTGQVPGQKAWDYYEVLAWVYVDADRFSSMEVHFWETGPDGRIWTDIRSSVRWFVQTLDPNGWMLIRIPYQLKVAESQLYLTFQGKDLNGKTMYVDELLIRSVDTGLFMENDTMIWHNDRYWAK